MIVAIAFAINTSFIDNKEIYITIIWLLLFVMVLIRKELSFDIGDLLLFVGMGTYALIDQEDIRDGFITGMRTIAVYQIAKCLASPQKNIESACSEEDALVDTDWIAYVVLALSLALFYRGLLNYSYLLTDRGAIGEGEWYKWQWHIPAWGRYPAPVVWNCNYHQFFIVLMGALIVYFTLLVKNNKALGLAGFVFSLIAVILGTLTDGKLGMVCCIGAALITVIVWLKQNYLFKDMKTLIIIGAVADAVTAIILLVKLRIPGFDKLWTVNDKLFYRKRLLGLGQAFKKLPSNLMGNYELDLYVDGIGYIDYAHNSWVDMAVRGGVIPLVCSAGFLVICVLAFKYLLTRTENTSIYMLLCAFLGMTMYHMLEPAVLAGFAFWNTEVFLGGLVYGLYSNMSGKRGFRLCLERLKKSIQTS